MPESKPTTLGAKSYKLPFVSEACLAAHVSRMEENKSVPVEKSEAEVILLPHYLKYSIKLLLLKPVLSKAREADEKEDTVAMPPPQVFRSET